jgi:hypothetical protein
MKRLSLRIGALKIFSQFLEYLNLEDRRFFQDILNNAAEDSTHHENKPSQWDRHIAV